MQTEDGMWIVCDSAFGCEQKFRNHKWGRIRGAVGWFFTRNGKFAFCPTHVPDHIVKWKEGNGSTTPAS
jgi:hypothetical protein